MISTGGVSVAIDIGNTAAKWSLRDDGSQGAVILHRAELRAEDWPDQIIRAVDGLAGGAAIRWRIAAVNGPARQQLVQRLGAAGQRADVIVITRGDLGITTKLPQPDRIGIDRLLASWKATRIYPQQRVIVVDAGSAITVDCASPAGEFLGGVILPGLALQLDSLARGTDALPALQLSQFAAGSAAELPIPAIDTVAAIRSGIMLGCAAAIDGLIGHSLTAEPHQVVLTGGDAARLSPLINQPHVVLEHLVIDAILDQCSR